MKACAVAQVFLGGLALSLACVTGVLRAEEKSDELLHLQQRMDRITTLVEEGRREGAAAGPALVKAMGDGEDWDGRVTAARLLGYIDYSEGNAALIAALKNEEDWRLVYAAAESLGRRQIKAAVPALRSVAASHWYPPVRRAAERALQRIAEPPSRPSDAEIPSMERLTEFDLSGPMKGDRKVKIVDPAQREGAPPEEQTVSVCLPSGLIQRRSYEPFRMVNLEDGFVVSDLSVELRLPMAYFIDAKSEMHPWDDVLGVKGMVARGEDLFLAGYTLSGWFRCGMIFRTSWDAAGHWRARPWRTLPGDPLTVSDSRKQPHLPKTTVFYAECSGGGVLVFADGRMQLVTTPPPREKSTPEAQMAELKKAGPYDDNQSYSLASAGPPGAFALGKYCLDPAMPDERVEIQAVGAAWNGLGVEAIAMVEPLLKMAGDTQAPANLRLRALSALGAIIRLPPSAVDQLLALYHGEKDPKVREAAAWALSSLHSSKVVPVIVTMMTNPETKSALPYLLGRLQDLGPLGIEAGPAVLSSLDDPDPQGQGDAANALGAIGYRSAVPRLIQIVQRREEFSPVFPAMEALILLQAREAIPVLEEYAREFWHRPSRAMAREAIRLLQDGETCQPYLGQMDPLVEAGEQARQERAWVCLREYEILKSIFDRKPDWLIRLPVLQPGGSLRLEEHVGIAVDGGYLIWEPRGAWSGEVSFVSPLGVKKSVIHSCFEALYRIPGGAVLLNPPVDISDDGCVYKLAPDAKGRWVATEWKALPSASHGSRQLSDGRVIIRAGGDVAILSPDGKMEALDEANLETLK